MSAISRSLGTPLAESHDQGDKGRMISDYADLTHKNHDASMILWFVATKLGPADLNKRVLHVVRSYTPFIATLK